MQPEILIREVAHSDGLLRGVVRERDAQVVGEPQVAGVTQGVIRSDVSATDILMTLAGISLVADTTHQREQAERLLDLLMDGITRPDGWRRGTTQSVP